MSEINSFSDYASRYNTNMDFSTLFGGGAPYIDSGMGGVNVSDYAMIKNGSYRKLMKAYYAKQDADKLSQTGDSSKTLTLMRSSADSLKKSAAARTRGVDKTYNKNGAYTDTISKLFQSTIDERVGSKDKDKVTDKSYWEQKLKEEKAKDKTGNKDKAD